MPIYEYSCGKCGKVFKYLHRSFDEAKPPCPECGSDKVTKLFSSFAVKSGGKNACGSEGSCPADSGHTCCPGCCHHHH